MSIQILNDIYKFVEKICSNNGTESVIGYSNGSFVHYDMISKGEGWELIDLANVASRVMEHINSVDYKKIYLYVSADEGYVCIEDPKEIKDSTDYYDENDNGLFVGID